jgi:hypothetical protein
MGLLRLQLVAMLNTSLWLVAAVEEDTLSLPVVAAVEQGVILPGQDMLLLLKPTQLQLALEVQ